MRKSILRNPQEQTTSTRDYSPHAAQPAPAPKFASARASYPVFLSLYDTLKLQIGWAWGGLMDAFRWDVVIGLMTRNVCFSPRFRLSWFFFNCYCSDPEVRANALKSFLLNGISLLSIYVFDLLLHPLSLSRGEEGREGARLQSQNALHRSIGWLYRILWLLPVVGVALYLNVRNKHFLSFFSFSVLPSPLRCQGSVR
jgi:etoposide-induced 2.4 mRNA